LIIVNGKSTYRPLPRITPEALSEEELRVARLLTAGCETDVIAQAMECPPAAVEAYCRSIYAKLGTKDRAVVIRWAMYHDIGRW